MASVDGSKDKNTTSSKKRILLGRQIQSRREVNVKLDNDENTPLITGCTVLFSGHIVLCDYINSKLKLLDTSSVLQGNLTLPDKPWDVSVVDDNNVIVTLPEKMQLQFTLVHPKMEAGRLIQLDKNCYGVEVSGDEIYTTCHENTACNGEVRILELNGNIKRRLGIQQDGSFRFTCPDYITVSQSDRKIFISDGSTGSVTSVTADGNIRHIIEQYEHDDLELACGLIVDADDNVVVCGYDSDYDSRIVEVFIANSSERDTLLFTDDLPHPPQSLAYRDNDDTLVVGCWDHDKVFLFQLAE